MMIHNLYSYHFYFSYLFHTVEQFLVFVIATDFDTLVQRLWTLCESGHSCHMGFNDCCRFKFGIFSCNTKSHRSITWRIGHFVGVCGRLFALFSKKILSPLFKWKPVIWLKIIDNFVCCFFFNFKWIVSFSMWWINNLGKSSARCWEYVQQFVRD